MAARLISAGCALAALAALTVVAALALRAPVIDESERAAMLDDAPREEQSQQSELDAALRMDTCTPVLAALSTALERASARAR